MNITLVSMRDNSRGTIHKMAIPCQSFHCNASTTDFVSTRVSEGPQVQSLLTIGNTDTRLELEGKDRVESSRTQDDAGTEYGNSGVHLELSNTLGPSSSGSAAVHVISLHRGKFDEKFELYEQHESKMRYRWHE